MLTEALFLGAAMLTTGVIVREYERANHGLRVVMLETDLKIANQDAAASERAELLAEARADRAETAQAAAEEQADVALQAMTVVAQKLSDELRAHAATKLRADTAEGHLSDLRAAAAQQEQADEPPPEPLPPGVYQFRAIPADTPWVAGPGAAS